METAFWRKAEQFFEDDVVKPVEKAAIWAYELLKEAVVKELPDTLKQLPTIVTKGVLAAESATGDKKSAALKSIAGDLEGLGLSFAENVAKDSLEGVASAIGTSQNTVDNLITSTVGYLRAKGVI